MLLKPGLFVAVARSVAVTASRAMVLFCMYVCMCVMAHTCCKQLIEHASFRCGQVDCISLPMHSTDLMKLQRWSFGSRNHVRWIHLVQPAHGYACTQFFCEVLRNNVRYLICVVPGAGAKTSQERLRGHSCCCVYRHLLSCHGLNAHRQVVQLSLLV